jgi:hypothetical protein
LTWKRAKTDDSNEVISLKKMRIFYGYSTYATDGAQGLQAATIQVESLHRKDGAGRTKNGGSRVRGNRH